VRSGFLARGSSVCIVGRREETVTAAVTTLRLNHSGYAEGVVADLSSVDGRAAISERLKETDILVNNAGAIPGGTLESLDPHRWQEAWDLKLHGYLATCRESDSQCYRHGWRQTQLWLRLWFDGEC